MKSTEIRRKFLDFFAKKKHKITKSSPIISKNDTSLMFINSGMAPFKDYFLSHNKIIDNRIANSQKCLRVSGKHNDLSDVGHDTYHHTFFEMLGNWSFGDYFKKEAISWSWELLTKEFGISSNDLYVTVFEGYSKDGLLKDTEALKIWNKIVDKDKILLCGKDDNFWEMGEQGPCGPCSEIHIDLRDQSEKDKVPAIDLINKSDPLVIELWNLVFIQYNRRANGKLEDLPKKHIDTGMGLERLAMVLQKVKSNYDIDIFKIIIKEIEQNTGIKYGSDEKCDIAMRVISDHLRAVSFAIADGQLPGNTGASYVIRRVLRRAVRYSFSFLEIKEPFIFKLVNALISSMGEFYNELNKNKDLIQNVIREEEKSFLKTLEQGLFLLEEIISSSKNKTISGKKAFELYDTYGFPVDLTSLILSERGFTLDIESFEIELEKQKRRSRKAAEIDFDDWVTLMDDPVQEFIGYDSLESNVRIVKYRKINSKKDGTVFQIVFNLTPFYAESGGQVGDIGFIQSSDGDTIHIIDTLKEGSLSVHIVKNLPKKLDQTFRAVVDRDNRFSIACNHTGTHLLHQALRDILGSHVEQRGSRVSSKGFRFDFSHFSKLTDDQINEIENFINTRIENEIPLEEERNVPTEVALSNGAIGLFGEKYGDVVRTIKFGNSYELCGGTHVKNTSKLWQFKLISESAIASGVRRIEGITSSSVRKFYNEKIQDYDRIEKLLNKPKNLSESVNLLNNEILSLRREINSLNKEKLVQLKDKIIQNLEIASDINLGCSTVDIRPTLLKELCFTIANEKDNLFLILACKDLDKIYCSCYISKSLVSSRGVNASDVISNLSEIIDGKGGGQPFYATCSGTKMDSLNKLISSAAELQKLLIK